MTLAAVILAAVMPTADVLLIWDEGDIDQAARALDAWYLANDRGDLTAFTFASGFPRIVRSNTFAAMAPGTDLVLLGVCDQAQARRQLPALRAVRSSASQRVADAPQLRGSCPAFAPRPADSLLALLEETSPRSAVAAARRRDEIAVCSFERSDLLARYGPNALCETLWGLSCAAYRRLAATTVAVRRDRCRFLVGGYSARTMTHHIVQWKRDALQLDVCVDGAGIAWVLAGNPDDTLFPVDALCNFDGPDGATISLAHAVGVGACVELHRGGGSVSLRCYAPHESAPHAGVDELPISGGYVRDGTSDWVHEAGQYAVVPHDNDTIICLQRPTERGVLKHAYRLTTGGVVSIARWPPTCAAAAYREPVSRNSPDTGTAP